MAPAFSKEAVFQGSIDHLCLVCESYLRSEREVCAHVSTPEHARNLSNTDYIEKHRDDRIRKVKKWYFCEFCNVLLSTMTKVRLHVDEPRHKDNIASQTVARVDDVIASGNITISEEAWHGLIDDNTCAICNVEFEDKLVHRTESTHIINLIQSKVRNDFKNIYRKTDDSTFHCLTCNTVVPAITTHIDDKDHKDSLLNCIKIKPTIDDGCKKENLVEELPVCVNETGVIAKEKGISKENISNRCDVTENNRTFTESNVDVTIDEDANNTKPTNYIIGDQRLQNYNEKVEEKSKETTRILHDAIQKIADEHDLTRTGNKVYCKICNKYIPFSVRNINEHVDGESHRLNTKLHSKSTHSKDNENKKINTRKNNISRVPTQMFIRNISTVKNMFAEDVVINEKYCINILAFTFLTMTSPGRLRCQACEIDVKMQDMRDHLTKKRHERALHEVPVIILTDSELIREVRSDVFQCGFCNITDSWEGMEDHLKSTSHKESKTFANWRLSQHLPQIEQHQRNRQVHNEFLMRLIMQ